MEDLLKEANEIINNKSVEERKEKARRTIMTGAMIAGIALTTCKEEERDKTIDKMAQACEEALKRHGFSVNGKPDEFKAKFMLMMLLPMFSDGFESFEQVSKKYFGELFWNVCVFDVKE